MRQSREARRRAPRTGAGVLLAAALLQGAAGRAEATAYILVAGGADAANTSRSACYVAPIGAGGALGAWTSTSALPAPRKEGGIAQSGSYVYFVGGSTDAFVATIVSTVYAAQIFPGGGVFAWAATTPYPGPIYQPALFADGGTLYGAAGYSGAGMTSACYFATASGGTVSSWSATSSTPGERDEHGGATMGGYFYLLGGREAAGLNPTNTDFTNTGSGGPLPPWGQTTVLPFNVVQPGFCATDGYLYQAGGNISGGGPLPINAAYSAPAAYGASGGWTTISALPIPLHEHAMVAYGSYLYVLGGLTINGSYSAAVYMTTAAGGGISGWTSTSPLPLPMGEHSTLVMDLSTPSQTKTPSPSPTPSGTRTPTRTASRTPTPTPTYSATESRTPTGTASESVSHTHSDTRTESLTPTRSETVSATASRTETATVSASASPTRTATASLCATWTATVTRSGSWTLSGSPTATVTPSGTRTGTPSASASLTASRTLTATVPSRTHTPVPSVTAPPGCQPGLTPAYLYVDRNSFFAVSEVAHVCFAIPDTQRARVRVFDGAGERIAVLFDGEAAGGVAYARVWDGRNESGLLVTSNVYVVQLDSPDWRLRRRVAALR